MSSLFTVIFIASIVWFFVTRRKDKKVNGKTSKNTWYILILTAISFILVGTTTPKSNTVADNTKQDKSSVKVSSSKKESSSSVSSKQSTKKEVKYDFSKVEYNMTMDQVINAVGQQPTDKSDYELYYGDDDFDFNDGKLIGSSVKSVQDKIDNKFKAESSSRKKEEADKSSEKSRAQYFGTRSVEYVQKHPSAYNSAKIDNGMEYMYMIDKGSYLVRYDTDDGYTNVYSYDGNSENKLGDTLYTGRTIFNQPATKKYYYIGGK